MFWGIGRKTTTTAPNPLPYRAFTKQFDREVAAADLRRELLPVGFLPGVEDALRATTTARIQATQRSMAFQTRYRGGHDLGDRPVFTFLIDHSGSMRGPKAMAAAMLADIVGGIFEYERQPLEILGFTTSSWKGGKSRASWRALGSPKNPGRLCDLLHIVYADASKPSKEWMRQLPLMLWDNALKENVDGEALIWARDRALLLKPTSWVCVHVSDGVPMDDSTVAANGGEQNGWYLYQHLAEAIGAFKTDDRIRLGCLSLEYDVSAYFQASRRVDTLEAAASTAFDLLEDLIWPTATKD